MIAFKVKQAGRQAVSQTDRNSAKQEMSTIDISVGRTVAHARPNVKSQMKTLHCSCLKHHERRIARIFKLMVKYTISIQLSNDANHCVWFDHSNRREKKTHTHKLHQIVFPIIYH